MPENRNILLDHLWDTGKLLSEIFYSETKARRAYITPGMSKPIKDLMDKSDSGTYLFGDNVEEKIMKARTMEKISKDIKSIPLPNNKNAPKPAGSGNWKGPSARGASQAGNKNKPTAPVPPKTPQDSRNSRDSRAYRAQNPNRSQQPKHRH